MWTHDRDNVIREHAPNLSAQKIADMLGVSRNAVIGRARRKGIQLGYKTPARQKTAKRVKAAKRITPAAKQLVMSKSGTCMWPHGDPGDPDFHFCGSPAVSLKPYCLEHCSIAYTYARPTVSEAKVRVWNGWGKMLY